MYDFTRNLFKRTWVLFLKQLYTNQGCFEHLTDESSLWAVSDVSINGYTKYHFEKRLNGNIFLKYEGELCYVFEIEEGSMYLMLIQGKSKYFTLLF